MILENVKLESCGCDGGFRGKPHKASRVNKGIRGKKNGKKFKAKFPILKFVSKFQGFEPRLI